MVKILAQLIRWKIGNFKNYFSQIFLALAVLSSHYLSLCLELTRNCWCWYQSQVFLCIYKRMLCSDRWPISSELLASCQRWQPFINLLSDINITDHQILTSCVHWPGLMIPHIEGDHTMTWRTFFAGMENHHLSQSLFSDSRIENPLIISER